MTCEHCKNEFTKTLEGKNIRRFLNGLTVCTKCAGNWKRRGTFEYARVEGIDYVEGCQFCPSEDRAKFKIGNMFVCDRCKRSYLSNGFIKPPKPKLTPEERAAKARKFQRDKTALIKERREYIKTLTPDELIKLVKEDIEEGRI